MRYLFYHIGIMTVPLIICFLAVIVLFIIKLVRVSNVDNPEKVGLFWIWLTGLIAFLFGFLGQVLSIRSSFEAIAQVGDVNASIVADSMALSIVSNVIGLSILIFAILLWGIVKSVQKQRANSL